MKIYNLTVFWCQVNELYLKIDSLQEFWPLMSGRKMRCQFKTDINHPHFKK